MNMDIKICSRKTCINDTVSDRNTNRLIVSISESEAEAGLMRRYAKFRCIDIKTFAFLDLTESFDDIAEYGRLPNTNDIEQILHFCNNEYPVTVHCHAGISRSSASAYLIGYMRSGDIKQAYGLLNYKLHSPNKLIIKLGEEVLGNDKLYSEYLRLNYEQTKEILKDKDWKDKLSI